MVKHCLLLLAILLLIGCGAAADRAPTSIAAPTATGNTSLTPQPKPSPPSTPIPTIDQAAAQATAVADTLHVTVVPVQRVTVQIAGATWSLLQPEGVAPVFAANDRGILWIAFSPMITSTAMLQSGIAEPLATSIDHVMFTPLRAGGGDLEQDALRVATLPNTSVAPDDYLHITSISPAADHRFLIRARGICFLCANSGTEYSWLIDPQAAQPDN